jgi:molybdopterin converting factor small subunit
MKGTTLMKVNIILFSDARRVVGSKNLQIELPDASTVNSALGELRRIYGSGFEEAIFDRKSNHYKMVFSINNKLSQVDKKLNAGDTLAIFPASGGG